MQISAIVNTHAESDVVLDTLDSIKTYMTDQIVTVVDGDCGKIPSSIQGCMHHSYRAPFRNMAFGMLNVIEKFPNSDWYCYLEYDCLIASSRFKENLKLADDMNVWMLGNDGHVDDVKIPIIESLVGEKLKSPYYLIGACQFFSQKFIQKLNEINFFNRFLNLTNGMADGVFPHYNGYDISEHMYPTLARHFGGNIGVFATYDYVKRKWHGSYRYFPIRWKPELDSDNENFEEASILHPLKSFDHPIRIYHRNKRNSHVI